MNIHTLAEGLEWLEHKTKPLFVGAALLAYAVSLVVLATQINPVTHLEDYLVGALGNLAIPFGIILLQEMLELITSISDSTLVSARRQFEIVVLVLVRSFFKKFDKVNEMVIAGEFGSYVREATVKVVAIVIIVALILYFRNLARTHSMRDYAQEGLKANLWKQLLAVILSVVVLLDMILIMSEFDEIVFIRIVFTGLIIIDAIFLILAILKDSSFSSLAFESGLVIGLIFARFPLFSSNTLSYALSIVGVAFATLSLYLLYLARRPEKKKKKDVEDVEDVEMETAV